MSYASVMARQGALFLQRQKEREIRNTSNQNSECKFPTKDKIAADEARELLPSRSSGTWEEGFAAGVLFVLKRWQDATGYADCDENGDKLSAFSDNCRPLVK